MPQTFQVLRCYKCEVFQVHPTKKSNKWKCKICDEKQSMKRFYGLGTGKECRLLVQKLNGIRGELESTLCRSDTSDLSTVSGSSEHSGQNEIPSCSVTKKSKWMDYMDPQVEETPKPKEEQVGPDSMMLLNNSEVGLELPKKRPRKCLTGTNTIVKKNGNISTQDYDTKLAILTNINTKTNLMKSTERYEANENTCKINPANNVPASTNIVNNSKWAKFVEGTQNSQEANAVDPVTNNHISIFPFLEDEDIDSVLDL